MSDLTADNRIKLVIGSQFVEIQSLNDTIASLKKHIEELEKELGEDKKNE